MNLSDLRYCVFDNGQIIHATRTKDKIKRNRGNKKWFKYLGYRNTILFEILHNFIVRHNDRIKHWWIGCKCNSSKK